MTVGHYMVMAFKFFCVSMTDGHYLYKISIFIKFIKMEDI